MWDSEEQIHHCAARSVANNIGSFHVLFFAVVAIMAADTNVGTGIDMGVILRLEVSTQERVAGAMIAVASLLAVAMFAFRETKGLYDFSVTQSANLVFLVCWVIAALTLATTMGKRDNAARAASRRLTAVDVVPHTYRYIFISLSFMSYTAPMLYALSQTTPGVFRGANGGFSNLLLMAHCMASCTDKRPSTRRLILAHLGVQILGAAGSYAVSVQDLGFDWSSMLGNMIGSAGILFEVWLCTRVLLPLLKVHSPSLYAKLPLTIFRWLFERGGLTVALYVYFESVSVGLDTERSSQNVDPWLWANSAMLMQFTFSALLAATVFADAGSSLSVMLRGKAPEHVSVSFALMSCTSLLALILFAGREFAGERQLVLFTQVYNLITLLWVMNIGITVVSLFPRYVRKRSSISSLSGGAGYSGEQNPSSDDSNVGAPGGGPEQQASVDDVSGASAISMV